jgi:hypothetical protein
MAEEIGFKLTVDPGNSEKTVKSFKQELKEANENVIKMARQFGELSPQAVAAATSVGKLKKEMEDANQLAGALTDEKRFQAFAGLAGSIAGGFSAAQGAISLATGESKEFEQAMLKVQSAMALANGLTQIADIGRFWGVAKASLSSFTVVQKANTAATTAATLIQKLFTGSVETTSTGFKVLRGAIIATGIGALIVAVGYVVNNFKSLKETIYKLLPFLETVEKFIGKIVQVVTDFVGITSEATRAADSLRDGIEGQNDAYDKQIQLLGASGAKSKEIRDVKNKMYDDEIGRLEKIASLKEGKEDDTKRLKELKFQKELLKAEQAKEDADDANEARKKAEEDHRRAVSDAKEKAKRVADEKKKAAEEAQKAEEEALNSAIEAQKSQHDYEMSLAKINGEDTVKLRQKQLDDEIETLNAFGGKYLEKVSDLEREKVIVAAQAKADAEAAQEKEDEERKGKQQEIADELKAKQDEELAKSRDGELSLLQEKYDAMRAVVKGNEQLTTAVIAAEAEAQTAVRKKWDDIALEQKRENASKLAGILGGLSAVVGKETAVGKGLAVAEATISTYLGASKALAGISSANPFGAALAIAQAATVVATGLKSVSQIVKTKVPTVSGGGGGASSAPAPITSPAVSTAPTLEGIQSTLVDQTKQLTEGKDALKAYVVESEITQKQERQRAITQTANF